MNLTKPIDQFVTISSSKRVVSLSRTFETLSSSVRSKMLARASMSLRLYTYAVSCSCNAKFPFLCGSSCSCQAHVWEFGLRHTRRDIHVCNTNTFRHMLDAADWPTQFRGQITDAGSLLACQMIMFFPRKERHNCLKERFRRVRHKETGCSECRVFVRMCFVESAHTLFTMCEHM